jgi:hypothetical protein
LKCFNRFWTCWLFAQKKPGSNCKGGDESLPKLKTYLCTLLCCVFDFVFLWLNCGAKISKLWKIYVVRTGKYKGPHTVHTFLAPAVLSKHQHWNYQFKWTIMERL